MEYLIIIIYVMQIYNLFTYGILNKKNNVLVIILKINLLRKLRIKLIII